MRATDLIGWAFAISVKDRQYLHSSWVDHSYKMAELAGEAHIIAVQSYGHLDIMLRQLEEEYLTAVPDQHFLFIKHYPFTFRVLDTEGL